MVVVLQPERIIILLGWKGGKRILICKLRVRVKYGDDGDDGDDGVVVNFNGHISVVYPL
jgi:hypothetical protein